MMQEQECMEALEEIAGLFSMVGTPEDVVARVRRSLDEEALLCAADVCMYCGGSAVGYGPATGPNSARDWVHFAADRPDIVGLCRASGIWARHAAIREREREAG
jgi:hypothetical protein